MSYEKDHPTPEAKVKEKMTKGQNNNYIIEKHFTHGFFCYDFKKNYFCQFYFLILRWLRI
jgi:hypothetical protein